MSNALLHWSTSDCAECGCPVAFVGSWGYPEGMWLHVGGPWSGAEADKRMGHIPAPKGDTCPCCRRLVEGFALQPANPEPETEKER